MTVYQRRGAPSAIGTIPMPAPTGVAATDTANLAAAVATADAVLAAGGAPEIKFQSCPYVSGVLTPYSLPGGLLVKQGVAYRGFDPVLRQQNNVAEQYMADAVYDFIGGTVLKGDGSGPGFYANNTPLGAVDANIGLSQIANVTIEGFGLDGFTDGMAIGAANIMGLVWSKVDRIWTRYCTGWGVRLINYAHCDIGQITTVTCPAGGQLYASHLPGKVFLPSNSTHRDLFHKKQNGPEARIERGIVFESAGTNAGWGQNVVQRVQVNDFNNQLLSVGATLTNGSADIIVPDGTLWRAGFLVQFATTVGGFTQGRTYVVLSVAGNVVTLGNSKRGAAIVASAAGTPTLETYGFPSIEMAGANTGALLSGNNFLSVDAEGASSGVYCEALYNSDLTLFGIPSGAGGGLVDIVGRGCVNSRFRALDDATNDFDAASASCEWSGYRGTVKGAITLYGAVTDGGTLLAVTQYTGTELVPTTTLTTLQTVDVVNAKISFTAPPSGRVLHRSRVTARNTGASGVQGGYHDGVSPLARSQQSLVFGSNLQGVVVEWLETGLTPGVVYTRYLAFAADASGTAEFRYGGTAPFRGPLLMQVYSA